MTTKSPSWVRSWLRAPSGQILLAFLAIAAQVPVKVSVETFPLEAANEALGCLREGRLEGAAVLLP